MAMIELPFTAPQFFDVFRRYNEAVWPAQWILYGVAALVLVRVWEGDRARLIPAGLALLWVWMGIAYQLTFFSAINPAAPIFAVLFVIQAMLLLNLARGREETVRPPQRWAMIGGRAFIAYALIGYPLVGYWAGHRYPEVPTFGAPCPTTIFTLGVLVTSYSRLPWWVVTIPLMWTVAGTSAAFQLSVPQDFGLPLAGLFTLIVLATRLRRSDPSSYPRPTPRASATRLM